MTSEETFDLYRYALFIAIKHLRKLQLEKGVYETEKEIRDTLLRNAEKELNRHKLERTNK